MRQRVTTTDTFPHVYNEQLFWLKISSGQNFKASVRACVVSALPIVSEQALVA